MPIVHALKNLFIFIAICSITLHLVFLLRDTPGMSFLFSPDRMSRISLYCDQTQATCYVLITPILYVTETVASYVV